MSTASALKNLFSSKASPGRASKAKRSDPWATKIDRLGELKTILEPVKPLQEEYDRIRKELVAALTPRGEPDAELTVSGQIYTLVLGPRSHERSVKDLHVLHSLIGHSNFLRVVRPSLTEIDKLLTADEVSTVIETMPGNRKIKALVSAVPG